MQKLRQVGSHEEKSVSGRSARVHPQSVAFCIAVLFLVKQPNLAAHFARVPKLPYNNKDLFESWLVKNWPVYIKLNFELVKRFVIP